MEVDSAANFTDTEKLTKFSVSYALRQLIDCGSLTNSEVTKLENYCSPTKWSPFIVERCLDDVARLLLCDKSALIDDIVRIFAPILVELIQRASCMQITPELKHYLLCVLFGKLITRNKSILQFIMQYFRNNPSPFQYKHGLEPPQKKHKTEKMNEVSELELCEASYHLLNSAPEHFKEIWDWSCFIEKFANHTDGEIRWIVCQSVAILHGMSEVEKLKLVMQSVSEKENRMYSLKYFISKMKVVELTHSVKNEESLGEINKNILSKAIVDVEGVLLPCFSQDQISTETVVPVTSTRGHLQNLALAITSNLPVLISGPVGCGKTTLVEHVAALTGRTVHNQGLLKVQLGDQTDAKVLLGTYHSTEIPGEFVWTAGVLTQAIREGRWLLLEDIDYAPMDVVSMLLPVIESLTLNVPGHGDVIRAAPGFQLFATQRTHVHGDGQALNAATMLKKMWRRLVIEPLTRSELQTVIDCRFPSLSVLTEKLLDAYYLLNEDQASTRMTINDRSLSPRDFFKWCQRIATEFRLDNTSLTSITSQLSIFQDALDCFVACVFNSDRRLQLAEDIGAKLNMIKAKAEFYCHSYKPVFNMSDDTVGIGRVSLKRYSNDSTTSKSTFSWTRNSSVLLERLAACVRQLEPVLLVGETGTGKTSSVQYLSQLLGHRLLVINLNQQSDSADLLGGYKPVDLKWKISPVRQEFERLFQETFNIQENIKFLSHISTCFANRRWSDLLRLMTHSQQSAVQRCKPEFRREWEQLGFQLQQLRLQIRHADSALAFSFVEGSLVKALKQGDWVLLDEINLATAETLECLSGLLESHQGSLFLLERGDREPVKRHPDFRLFAAMNPATDVGKKQLPTGLRSRFTEFIVDEITSSHDLATLIGDYLRELNLTATQIEGIVRFYLEIRGEALRSLADGTGRQPHFSLRTLCRALTVASSNPCGTVARSLYEAFCLSFLTQLDRSSHPIVEKLVVRYVIGNKNLKSVMGQALIQPRPLWSGQTESIQVEGYWIPKGDLEPREPKNYILTDSVRLNLKDLVRVVSLGRLPVLLQGETSVGKTSLIGYLAQLTGNKCVRVNNHEHTDLQEYVGSYTADQTTGKLIFREGVLVDAMRQGYWLILDELNLAPSEVLEALNRLLDDNRELFIAETQETVKAHPRFLLFATQNPPGGNYGGRKLLSRAFRNRFVELHFNDIPPQELETILHQRCDMPPSYCKRCVAVMGELQLRRRGSAAFAGKQGFMTLRDLFRWAERYRLATDSAAQFYDWDQHLADEGYLVLAGRVRKDEEALVIRQVLGKHFKRTVDPQRLFTLSDETSPVTRPILESLQRVAGFDHLVWTFALRRLAVLVGQALRFVEPVLMVGDTGCGKTSVCQYLAGQKNCQLMTINCHQYSEGSDFLGGLRPVRNLQDQQTESGTVDRLFEWVDGPLVMSLMGGHYFLADEISLADDSVLERLNSVLEPERSLLLSEKAGSGEPEVIHAAERFRFLATMNPGGDYGKKELSPALRNRLTEIWCPMSRDRQDIIDIADHNLTRKWITTTDGQNKSIAVCIVDFVEWFSKSETGRKSTVSIRDILSWVQFINAVQLDPAAAYVHGACLVFLDSLVNRTMVEEAVHRLAAFVNNPVDIDALMGRSSSAVKLHQGLFGIDPFYIKTGPRTPSQSSFTFQAPSTSANLVRLLRALQLKKPLLLEGSPGVGKTSLVAALAEATGHELVRINLSEQTDVSDLFGADLPVEGSETGGRFEWRDGPLLRALKEGQWIVLDELNLASQSVLEGLNAVLDHRGELYIPELGRSFRVQPQMTKLFACQNPLKQGGARKGLPRSFLNRFTQVYVDPLSKDDLKFIARSVYPHIDPAVVIKMVDFNEQLVKEVTQLGQWGLRGGPWEFNLRDVFRWCQAVEAGQSPRLNPGQYVGLIYADRMRNLQDREMMLCTYERVFGPDHPLPRGQDLNVYLTQSFVQVGSAVLPRGIHHGDSSSDSVDARELLILQRNLRPLESLMHCIALNWMTIVVGPRACGKTSLVRLAAQLTGHPLDILNTNSAMDTTELLGGFEQGDVNRTLEELAGQVDGLIRQSARRRLANSVKDPTVVNLLQSWENYRRLSLDGRENARTTVEEAQHLERRAQLLDKVLALVDDDTEVTAKAAVIKTKLNKVVQQAGRVASTGNSGGCFEWVDSLLVKALRNGHWLLVDNVNLCSSSVLDRLNGLLEPGGHLALSERGVIDGNIPLVKPHPEFRLFLAMDPRHGEISRAMRNRGVELFLPGSDEMEYPDTDLASVLSLAGLTNQLLQQILLQFHQWLCRELLPVGERPTLTELVQAASLTAQRLEMFTTASPFSCLDDTCVEVYIRNIRSPDNKEAGRAVLSTLLQSAFSGQTPSGGRPAACALSTRQIQLSSVLARVRQATLPVQQLVQTDASRDAVLFLYLTASQLDLEWRRDCIDKSLSSGAALLAEALRGQLKDLSDLPWDCRWFGNISRKHFNIDVDTEDGQSLVNNRISLALFWTAWNVLRNESGHPPGRTLAALTRAIDAGTLAEEAAPDKLLVSVPRFLGQLDRAVQRLLTTDHVQLTNSEWAGLLEALEMRKNMLDVEALSVCDDQLETSLSRLAQYWCWLLKRTVPVVSGLLQRFPVAKLDLPVEVDRSQSVVLSRRLRRWLEQRAEPFVDESQSHKARLVSSILSSCCLPAVAGSSQSYQLVRSIARQLSEADLDKLTHLERELNRIAQEPETSDGQAQLYVLSLVDHVLMLGYYRNPTQFLSGLVSAGPTVSGALLQAGPLCWIESHLAHWEMVTNLSWSRRGQYLAVSPLFSLTAANVLEGNGQVALGQSEEKRSRLKTLEGIFWNNSDNLQRPDFDPLINDHRLAVRSVQHLIQGVCRSLRVEDGTSTESWKSLGVNPEAIKVIDQALCLVDNSMDVGSLWLLQGLARCLLLASGDEVDPVEKRVLKTALRRREAERVDHFLQVHRLHHELVVGGDLTMATQHPHVRLLASRKESLVNKLDEERTRKPTWRPESSLFQQLTKDIRHYVNSVASAKSVLALHDRLKGFRNGKNESGMLISQTELWLSAQRSFYQSLKMKYVDYPDIVVPLLAGIGQMMHGAELLMRNVKSTGWKYDFGDDNSDWSDSIADIFDRPSRLSAHQPAGVVGLAQLCTSTGVGRLFDAVFQQPMERNENKKKLLFSALKDIERYTHHARWIDPQAWTTQTAILDALVSSWAASEERRKQREQEKESLYKSRTVHHEGEVSDAEAEKQALEQFFPSYQEEFQEEDCPVASMETEETEEADLCDFELTPADQQFICQRHVSLLLRWAKSVYISSSDTDGRPTEPSSDQGGFFMRYPLLGRITATLEPCLSTQFDRRLIGAHLIFIERVLTHGQTDIPSSDKFDFYYDPRVDEAVLCRPVLEHLKTRIVDLLTQWPGHATLDDVLKLIDRILSFAVDSPIMKLVTGLEMLLTKCHEWEANAHRGVSISEDIHALSRLILRWRTLELDCWKMCLDNVERRAADSAARYWFHLYSTITSLLDDKKSNSTTTDLTQVQSTLRQFMESATLGQYEMRLRMLRAFACHVALSGRQEDLLRLLWHALLFYGQFLPLVVKRKTTLRQPIDKKVRDFIKIMRWNDINYYALKEAVHKAHTSLHKHMKEWRDVLEQPARTVLSEPGVDLETETNSCLVAIPVEPFIASAQSMTAYDTVALAHHSVLSRLPSLYSKSLTLCSKTLRKCPFQRRIQAVDDLVGTVIGSVNQLQKLKVIGLGADKERQKNEAKSISMRKRKSLFQLFRSLQQLGISYRKGAFLWSQESGLASLQLVLPVLEVEASLEHLPQRSTHSVIRTAWDKGPHYYTRCLARLAVSAKLLEKPSGELGPSTVERIKGFAAQFMAIIQDQWRSCSMTLDKLVHLRMLVAQLNGLRFSSEPVPESSVVIHNLDYLWQLVIDALAVLEEFESLMKACPSGSIDVQLFQLRLEDDSSKLVTNDIAASILSLQFKLVEKLKTVRQDLEKEFHLFRISSASSWLFGHQQWNCISSGFKTIEDSRTLLEEMVSLAGPHNFGSCLELLRQRFMAAVDGFQTQKKPVAIAQVGAADVDKLCQSVLHGIQEIYKKYAESMETKTDGPEEEEEEGDDDFEIDHLTVKLMSEMQTDVTKVLKLDANMTELTRLLELAKEDDRNAQILSRCSPVFDQYTFVVEYYLSSQLSTLRTSSKLLSVLLNVFNQLLEKGFCLPSELDDSKEGGAGTRFEENESGGLGEGEGAKDVSDQIEDEDQLDTARQQGQEEEKNEKDDQNGPKEEENGIEMSEDFDAELQDREKKEGDDGDDDSTKSDDEDEDNLDKEMGETGEGADQLEEKLWGSDEEDGDESDQDQEDGQGDGKKEESEMTAKQDGDDEQGENDDGRDKKKEKPKKKDDKDEDDENVNDDQIDPYHTSHEPDPEPEPLDVPDDLNLDGGDPKDKEGEEDDQGEENPFDIDAMKNEPELNEMEDDDGKSKEVEDESKPGDADEDGPDDPAESKDNEADHKPEDGNEDEEGGEEGKDKEMEESAEGDNPQQADAPEQAVPSKDQPSETEAQPAAEESVKGSQDKTAKKDTVDNTPEEDGGQNQEADNEDIEGIGTAESRQNQGHEGQEKSKVNRKTLNEKEDEDRGRGKPKKPGQSDPNRALADERKERVLQVHTTETKSQREEEDDGAEPDENAVSEDNIFEHVKKVDQLYDALAKDAATEEQAKEQLSILQQKEEDKELNNEKDEEEDDVVMKEDDVVDDETAIDQLEAEKLSESKKKGRKRGEAGAMDEDAEENPVEIEGEKVLTMTVQRGPESSYVTQTDLMLPPESIVSMETVEQLRCDLEQRLATWSTSQVDDSEGQDTWRKLEMVTSGLAQDLCEQLRLILEPSQASRLRGDYRTGKRLNMRKVIPYIASQFRKDRIWLRRTKPAQRNYQIVLAVDDSSSMADNRSKELAFESVALISKALSLLEAGQLGVVSFGEKVQLLHPLHDTFNDTSGPRILQQFTFEQKKTKISELVDFVTALMSQARSTSSAQLSSTAQLLLIVSDGRGLFSEGSDCVHQAIRRAKQAGLFMVFVILDNPEGKDSILDIRVPIFDRVSGKLEGIKPYLDSFPFPFYVILRNIQTLPVVLSDALRQWFELVTSSSIV